MSDLLSKIESINRDAADGLKQAGLLTDSAIKSLSRDDLRDLFPGNDKFQMRRSIYEIIHKPEPVDEVFKEEKGFVPCDSPQGGVMSELMSKIENINRDAALVLWEAGYRTDSAIKALSRDDLRVRFPGSDHFQMRRSIYEIIHKTEPVGAVFKELTGFVPFDSLHAALENEKVLDYLHMMKEMKAHVDKIQGFLQAHIDNLEELKNAEPQQKPDKGPVSDTSSSIPPHPMECDDSQTGGQSQGAHDHWTAAGTSGANGQVGPHSGPNDHSSQEASGSSGTSGAVVPYSGPNDHYSERGRDTSSGTGSSGASGTVVPYSGPNDHYSERGRGSWRSPFSGVPLQREQVIYRSVVSGKTFGADVQLMTKMEQQGQDRVRLVQRRGDHEVTVLFCPISSRVGADVDAAMSDVEGEDKDIILVLMHHVREPKPTTNIRTWTDYKRVVFHVHVFYHETNNGLLSCPQNNDAFSLIWNKLLEYKIPDTSGNALGVGDGWGLATNRGGNNSSSGGSNLWLLAKPSWWPR